MRFVTGLLLFFFLIGIIALVIFGIYHAMEDKEAARQEESRVNVRWLLAVQECRWSDVPDFTFPDRDTGEPGYDFKACMKDEYARLLEEGK